MKQLTLIFFKDTNELKEPYFYVAKHECRRFDSDERIFDQIRNISPQTRLPGGMCVKVWTQKGYYECITTDWKGVFRTFVLIEQLKGLRIPDDASRRNRVIKSFIDGLPNNIPVILYWEEKKTSIVL